MKSRMMKLGTALGAALLAASVWAQNSPTPPPASPPPAPPSADQKPKVEYVQLTIGGAVKGDIVLELNREKAPISVDNFLKYVDKKFYDGTIFHRIVKKIPNASAIDVIQGGGWTADYKQKPTDPPIKNEWQNGLKNDRGTISMARTSAPDSATSQFFINVTANPTLDDARSSAAYAVFGKIFAGMTVVESIHNTPTTRKTPAGVPFPLEGAPAENIVIEKAVRISADDAKKKSQDDAKPATPAAPPTPTAPGP